MSLLSLFAPKHTLHLPDVLADREEMVRIETRRRERNIQLARLVPTLSGADDRFAQRIAAAFKE